MSDHIQTLADLLRSDDHGNHAVAAAIASDEDFVAAVQLLVDEAEEVFNQGFFYLLDVFVSSKINLMVFEAGDDRFMTYYPQSNKRIFDCGAIHHPNTAAAALHIKKILLE